jgi:ribosomal protein S18 acetylase RimI-like enzyme
MPFDIRYMACAEDDRAFFRAVHHAAYRATIESMFGWAEGVQDVAADRDFDSRNPHIVSVDGERVGVVGWLIRAEDLWLGPVFILPEFQNRGIGTAVVRHFMAEAQRQNLPLRLQTLKANQGAKRLYEGLGFRNLPSDEIHWQMEWVPPQEGI